jgi:hypothetical protein
MEDLSLSRSEIMCHPVRSNVTTGQKTHSYRTGLFDKLRFGMARLNTKLHDLLSTAPPTLYEPTPIEDIGNEWVARTGRMIMLEILHS